MQLSVRACVQVPEKYIERVPIQKVRQVQKPTSVIREVESWETVAVPTTRRVVVPGHRVEEVPDSRVVEVSSTTQPMQAGTVCSSTTRVLTVCVCVAVCCCCCCCCCV